MESALNLTRPYGMAVCTTYVVLLLDPECTQKIPNIGEKLRTFSNNSEKITENNARLFAPICRDPRSCEIKTFPWLP